MIEMITGDTDEQKRLHVDSKLIECFFKAITKWLLAKID